MRANKTMRALLAAYGVDPDGEAPVGCASPIRQERDASGRPYWISPDGCVLMGLITEDLSRYEFDANEVYLAVHSEDGVPGLLRDGIGIMRDWKRELEEQAPDTRFFIMATLDWGDLLINKEDYPDGDYALTLRFWAERNGNTVVGFEAFEEWDQPALLDECAGAAGAAGSRPPTGR